MRSIVALVLLAGAPVASALELLSVSVDQVAKTYTMHSEVRFGVLLEPLYEIMTDWDLSTQYSSVVVEFRNTGPDELGRRTKTAVGGRVGGATQDCLLAFRYP